MMPNGNNLALTLASDMGKTPTKSSKKTSIKNDEFLKIFGKNKKDEKEKTSTNTLGFMVQPFKIVGQTPNLKVSNEKVGNGSLVVGKSTDKAKVSSDKNESNVALSKITGNKAVEVLGNRIESTKSANLKLEDNTGNKETLSLIKPLEKKEVLSVKEVKKPVEAQNLRGKMLESTVEKTANTKEINFAENPNSEVQNKGRIAGTLSKVNPLQGKELQAKDSSNFVKSETKKLEPVQELVSGYGLKKINNQIKLEEKVENVRNLMPLEKNVSKEKVSEKTSEKIEIASINSIPREMNFETREVASLSRVNQSVDYNSIVQQVENGLKINYNNQLKEMKIKLQPEELGEVEVKMTIENNIMKAEFVVESQTVKEILESKFDTLRNALENKGFSGAEINVSVSTGDNKKSQSFFMANEEMKKESKDSVDYVSKIENLDGNSKITKISNSSGIDIMI